MKLQLIYCTWNGITMRRLIVEEVGISVESWHEIFTDKLNVHGVAAKFFIFNNWTAEGKSNGRLPATFWANEDETFTQKNVESFLPQIAYNNNRQEHWNNLHSNNNNAGTKRDIDNPEVSGTRKVIRNCSS